MTEHFFGLHSGHLPEAADKIAKRFGAWHVNYDEPTGNGEHRQRGWFACPNRGEPFDSRIARAVLDAIAKELPSEKVRR